MAGKEIKRSYWHEPRKVPLKWMTVPDQIDYWADRTPNKEAFVVRMNGQPRESITFGELKVKTEQLAAGLLKLGLKPGDFVMITGITCLNWLLVHFACSSIGIHTVKCRMSVLTKEGLSVIINQNNVKALFFHTGEALELLQHFKRCIPDAFQSYTKGNVQCKELPGLQYIVCLNENDEGPLSANDLSCNDADNLAVRQLKQQVDAEGLESCAMTSGSTGFPKAIPFSHFNVLNIHISRMLTGAITERTRLFNDRSLAWMVSMIYIPLVFGSCNIYVHPLTSAADADVDFSLQVIKEEECNTAVLLQYLMIDMLDRLEKHKSNTFHLKCVISGGEVLQESVIKSMSNYVDSFITMYGLTEAGIICSTPKADPINCITEYTGTVENGIELKIVNDKGTIVPIGEVGEILFRSVIAFKGYLQKESKGLIIDKDGWIHTDDAGILTSDGHVKVFGRKSDCISRGITLTYPFVVEKEMLKFPGVAKVAVIGVPDKRLGQNICACVITKEGVNMTEGDLLENFNNLYQSDEGLGITPAYFLFMDAFPTTNAKVDKKQLLKMAVEKLKLNI